MVHRMTQEQRVWVIAGPTASGKSGLALALAERLGGVVVNADALQVYEDLRILTARPSAEDERRVPHRLYGVLPAAQRCSAGEWLRLVEPQISAALADGVPPIVVGGTGLYIDALINGLAPIPEVDPAFRTAAAALFEELGPERFHQALAVRDPATAARFPPQDRQRMTRAWEVVEATGRPLSQWQREEPAKQKLSFTSVLLLPPRQRLYETCDARFISMVRGGAIDEVAALRQAGMDDGTPVSKAVGVRELGAFLRGMTSLDQAVANAQTATRHLAKRQMTWFRHRFHPNHTIEEQFCSNKLDEMLSKIT